MAVGLYWMMFKSFLVKTENLNLKFCVVVTAEQS